MRNTLITCVIVFLSIISQSVFAQTYTLTDDDVVVNGGFIESCSYSFALTDIIIPDVLDWQSVIGITYYYINGVFSNRGITSIVIPNTITNIPGFCFSHNAISSLDLSNNTNLISIGHYAFMDNQLVSINIPNNVTSIRYAAFNQNDIVTINNIQSDGFVFARDDTGNDDITKIVSYGGNNTNVILPSGVVTIGYDSFRQSNLSSVDFSQCINTLTTIRTMAFGQNQLTSVDLGNFSSLTSIDSSAFSYNIIDTLDLNGCNNLIIIDEGAFYDNNLPSLVLTGCNNLTSIGLLTFYFNQISNVNLNDCDKLSSIYGWAFHNNNISSVNIDSCESLVYIGEGVFFDNNITGFTLPNPIMPDSTLIGWEDSYGTMHNGGDMVTDLTSYYDAEFTETLIYDITFTVTDGTNPIENANVNLTGYGDQTTDASGIAIFTNVIPENDIVYTITATAYNQLIDSLSVVNTDINEPVTLILTTYDVTFDVTDGVDPIENATISLDGYGSQVTDATGAAIFSNIAPENDIVYSVVATGYNNYVDSLSVIDLDVSEQVILELTSYDVTFTITDGTDPVENATVTLNGYGSQVTDASGIAIFIDVVPENDIPYSVVAAGFVGHNGNVSVVDTDISESVILTPAATSYNVTFSVTDGTSPIEGAAINLSGYGTQVTDSYGIAIFAEVSPGVDIPYNTNASGYETFYGFVTVIDEDIEETVTLFLASYEVTFEISDANGNIEGALVELDGYGSQYTNSTGNAVFIDVFPGLLEYTVSESQYFDVDGNISVVDEDIIELVLLTPTTIINQQKNNIEIFPNPAQNRVSITNADNMEITIFSKYGDVLYTSQKYNSDFIDVREYGSGLYFIKVDNTITKLLISK